MVHVKCMCAVPGFSMCCECSGFVQGAVRVRIALVRLLPNEATNTQTTQLLVRVRPGGVTCELAICKAAC
jgi:hypothetical protein